MDLYLLSVHKISMPNLRIKKSLNISIDFDSTLVKTMELWINELNKRKGTNFRVNNITNWDLYKRFNISKSEKLDIFDTAVWNKKNFWKVPPTEDNLPAKIREIKKYGKVDIVTVLPPHHVEYSKKWLAHYNIPFDNYQLVPEGKRKTDMPYDVFIDDNPRMTANTEKKVLLYNQPWNQNVRNGIIRVYNFDEVIHFFELCYSHLIK